VHFLFIEGGDMKKITRKELDDVVAKIVKQREKIEPYVSKYQQDIAPKIKEYAEKAVTEYHEFADKAVTEYREKAAPKILQHKKVMTTLFYMYTNTTVYKSSRQRFKGQTVAGRVKR